MDLKCLSKFDTTRSEFKTPFEVPSKRPSSKGTNVKELKVCKMKKKKINDVNRQQIIDTPLSVEVPIFSKNNFLTEFGRCVVYLKDFKIIVPLSHQKDAIPCKVTEVAGKFTQLNEFSIAQPIFDPRCQINSLPEHCLLKIFGNLKFRSLADILQVGHVCTLWRANYRHIVAKKVDTLQLVLCPDEQLKELYKDYLSDSMLDHLDNELAIQTRTPSTIRVHFERFEEDMIDTLLDVMRNIKTLDIVISGLYVYIMDDVIAFLARQPNWTANLITFKLRVDFHPKSNISAVRTRMFQLFCQINRLMTSLKSLSICSLFALYENVCYSFDNGQCSQELEWPFVSRLRTFNFYSYDSLDQTPLVYSVNKFAVEDQLERVGIGLYSSGQDDDFFSQNEFSHLYNKLFSQFRSKLVALSLLKIQQNQEPQINFADCSSLNTVRINLQSSVSLVCLANVLAPLRQLVQLELRMTNAILFTDDSHVPIDSITQLQSVKILIIIFKLSANLDLGSKYLARILPNVQVLDIKHKCSKCCGGEESNNTKIMMKRHVHDKLMKMHLRKLITQFSNARVMHTDFPIYANDKCDDI